MCEISVSFSYMPSFSNQRLREAKWLVLGHRAGTGRAEMRTRFPALQLCVPSSLWCYSHPISSILRYHCLNNNCLFSEDLKSPLLPCWSFPGGSGVGICLPMREMQEVWVWSLGWEDPLEEGMTILAWRIPWTEEPSRQQSIGWQRVRHHWVTEHALL